MFFQSTRQKKEAELSRRRKSGVPASNRTARPASISINDELLSWRLDDDHKQSNAALRGGGWQCGPSQLRPQAKQSLRWTTSTSYVASSLRTRLTARQAAGVPRSERTRVHVDRACVAAGAPRAVGLIPRGRRRQTPGESSFWSLGFFCLLTGTKDKQLAGPLVRGSMWQLVLTCTLLWLAGDDVLVDQDTLC